MAHRTEVVHGDGSGDGGSVFVLVGRQKLDDVLARLRDAVAPGDVVVADDDESLLQRLGGANVTLLHHVR